MTDQSWPLTAPIGLKKPTLRRLPELRCIVVNPRLRLLSIVSKRSMKIDTPETCDIRYGFHGFAHSQISISQHHLANFFQLFGMYRLQLGVQKVWHYLCFFNQNEIQ